MAQKGRQGTSKRKTKQTSTPLNAGEEIDGLPHFKGISSIKGFCKRIDIESTESISVPEFKTSSTNLLVNRKFSVGGKTYSSKPKPDSPLEPKRSSQVSNSFGTVPQKLKFSLSSDRVQKAEVIWSSEKNASTSGEFTEDSTEEECPDLSTAHRCEVENLQSRKHDRSSRHVNELSRHEYLFTEDDSLNSPESKRNCSSVSEITECPVPSVIDLIEDFNNSSTSIEISRKDCSNLDFSTSTINLNLFEDDLKFPEESNDYMDMSKSESTIVLFKDENGEGVIQETKPVVKVCDQNKSNKQLSNLTSTDNVNNVCWEVINDYWKEVSSLCQPQLSKLSHSSSKDESKTVLDKVLSKPIQATTSSNHLLRKPESQVISLTDTNLKEKRALIKSDEPNAFKDFERNNDDQTDPEISAQYSRAAQKKCKKVAKTGTKSKLRHARKNTRKKICKIKRQNTNVFSCPTTSTPKKSIEDSQKSSPLKNISLFERSAEGFNKSSDLEGLPMTRIKAAKVYGRPIKKRAVSNASRKWESFLGKGAGRNVQRDNGKSKEFQGEETDSDSSNSILFKSTQRILLEDELDNDHLKPSRENNLKQQKSMTSDGKIRDKMPKNHRKKWYESKKFRELANHFNEVSKHSLVIEVEKNH